MLFIALFENANRNNGNTFKTSDRALASETGLGTRTICDARKKLREFELISFSRDEGQSYAYTLKRYSFDWVRLEQRLRQDRKPRALFLKRTRA